MGEWIVQNWLALIGTVAGVLAIPVSVLTARTWGNRRRKLLFRYSVTPILGTLGKEGLLTDSLEIRHNGTPILDPHVVSVTITNTGSVDLTSPHFDRSEPLKVKVGLGEFSAFIRTTMPDGQSVALVQEPGPPNEDTEKGHLIKTTIEFPPQLLRRGQSWSAEILFSGGTPNVHIVNNIADTDISTEALADLPDRKDPITRR